MDNLIIIYKIQMGSYVNMYNAFLTLFNNFIHRQHFTTVDNSSLEDKVQSIEKTIPGNSLGLIW